MRLAAFCLWLAAFHPADGPDVDVRILIAKKQVTFTVLMNLAYVDEIVDTPRQDETAVPRSCPVICSSAFAIRLAAWPLRFSSIAIIRGMAS